MAKRASIIVILLLFAATILWIIWENRSLTVTSYCVASEKLPENFNGFRIAHISDLHNAKIGQDNKNLLSMLYDTAPDLIAITGDLIDSRNTDIDVALQFVNEAVMIAPCYYVTGNHEARIDECGAFKDSLRELGVTVLDDAWLELEDSGQSITLIGVADPSFHTDYLFGDAASVMDKMLSNMDLNDDSFQLLLSHRPELYQVYVDHRFDLILSGHAHGGQFRLPLIGGLYAPNQGFFPKYEAGLYKNGTTCMIVNRGIGNSIIPFRFNNRPELVLIEFTTKASD